MLVVGALLLGIGLAVGAFAGSRIASRRAAAARSSRRARPGDGDLAPGGAALHEVERDRVGAYAALREQVAALHRTSTDLGSETRSLVNALRAPMVRGRWGEVQLQRIVELAGMVEHCDFDTQVSAAAPVCGPTWWSPAGRRPAHPGRREGAVRRVAAGGRVPTTSGVADN